MVIERKRVGIFLSLLTSGTLVGYFIGKMESPDPNKPETARWYLTMYSKWQRVDTQRGKLTLDTKYRQYTFTTGDSKVTFHQRSLNDMVDVPPPKRDFDSDLKELLEIAVAPPVEAGFLTTMLNSGEKVGQVLSVPERVALTVATIGSGVIGYALGHDSEPDTTNSTFEKTLETDVGTWSDIERQWRHVYVAARTDVDVRLLTSDLVAADSKNSRDDTRRTASWAKINKLHPEIQAQIWTDPEIIKTLQIKQDERLKSANDQLQGPLRQ